MNTDKKNDLRDLTRRETVTFCIGKERTDRVFIIREHSRDEQDEYIDLQQAADEQLAVSAVELGTKKQSAVETVKATIGLRWQHLAPSVAFVLKEPVDGLPAPTAEDVAKGLNERKVLALMSIQNELDGFDELKKSMETMNKALAQSQVSQLLNGETGTPSTTGSPSGTAVSQMK